MAEVINNKIDIKEYLLKIAPSPSVLDMLEGRLDRYGATKYDNIIYDSTRENPGLIFRGLFRSEAEIIFSNATFSSSLISENGITKSASDGYFYYIAYIDASDDITGLSLKSDKPILGVAF